mgnify:CR=1 FL=1
MKFKDEGELENYIKKSQSLLNEWADKTPLPGCSVARDKNGNVVTLTLRASSKNLRRIANTREGANISSVKEKGEGGCETCAARGLKRLISGGAKLLKSELGIDAAEEHTITTRKEICTKCPIQELGVCREKDDEGNIIGGCGCFCAAKVKLKTEECPIGKW